MKRKRRKFTDELKQETVRLVREGGESIGEVSRDSHHPHRTKESCHQLLAPTRQRQPLGGQSTVGRAAVRLLVAAWLTLQLCGCAAVLRHPRTPFSPDSPDHVPWLLTRPLLDGERRVLIVVENHEGREPDLRALESFRRRVSGYSGKEALLRGTDSAPPCQWISDDEAQCDGIDPQKEYPVFLQYVGQADYFGETRPIRGRVKSIEIPTSGIRIAQTTLDGEAFLWLSRRRLEEMTLLHEYGHALGLASNPQHSYLDDYPDLSRASAHCRNPNCPVSRPTWRAVVYGALRTGLTFRFLTDYCADCRKDIAAAKSFWISGTAPAGMRPSKTPPDTAQRAMKALGDRGFREEWRVYSLRRFGKQVVPLLFKKLRSLQRTDRNQELLNCDWIIKTIVMDQAVARAGAGAIGGWIMGDQSAVLLSWWENHEAAFMQGDAWPLPSAITLQLPTDTGAGESLDRTHIERRY